MPNAQWYFQQQTIGNPDTEGPVSHQQLLALIRSGTVKPKALVCSNEVTQGQWLSAAKVPVLREAMERFRQEAQQQKAEKKKAAADERMQRAQERDKRRQEQRTASLTAFEQEFGKESGLIGGRDSPKKFVQTCERFIFGIRIIGWGILILVAIGQIAAIVVGVVAQKDGALQALQASSAAGLAGFFAIAIQLAIGCIVIEASVLFLRFMRMIVVLLDDKKHT